MNRECVYATRCRWCFMEACPFGRNGTPSEDEYKTANCKCSKYKAKEYK